MSAWHPHFPCSHGMMTTAIMYCSQPLKFMLQRYKILMYHLVTISLAECFNPPQRLTGSADDRPPAGCRPAHSLPIRSYSALTPSPRLLCSNSAWRQFATWAMVGGLRGIELALFTSPPIWFIDVVFRKIISSVSTRLFFPHARQGNLYSIHPLTEEINKANVACTTINPSSKSRCIPKIHT